MRDPYEVLGVSRSASAEDIKKADRRPSYQDREALRTQDKVIRGRLAAQLDLHIARVERLKGKLTILSTPGEGTRVKGRLGP